jgi:hypothetical protein
MPKDGHEAEREKARRDMTDRKNVAVDIVDDEARSLKGLGPRDKIGYVHAYILIAGGRFPQASIIVLAAFHP